MKVFVEEQRFKRWALASLISLPLTGSVISSIFIKKEFPTIESNNYWGTVFLIISIAIVLILFLSNKLNTKINEQGIYYQFFPLNFSEKFISWSEVDQSSIRKYNSIRTFGRYGYRKRGLTMNVGGKFEIQLVLKNGIKILIGTQNVKDLKRSLETYKPKFKTIEN